MNAFGTFDFLPSCLLSFSSVSPILLSIRSQFHQHFIADFARFCNKPKHSNRVKFHNHKNLKHVVNFLPYVFVFVSAIWKVKLTSEQRWKQDARVCNKRGIFLECRKSLFLQNSKTFQIYFWQRVDYLSDFSKKWRGKMDFKCFLLCVFLRRRVGVWSIVTSSKFRFQT